MNSKKSNPKTTGMITRSRKNNQQWKMEVENPRLARPVPAPSQSDMESLIEYQPSQDSGSNFEVGDLVNKKYRVISELGEGAFGRVLEVRHQQKLQVYALKIVKNEDQQSDDEELDIEKEAELCAQLNRKDYNDDHGIVRMIDSFQFKGTFCMVFHEYGFNFADVLKMNNCGFPLRLVQSLFKNILKAVNFIHENGIIHTDLKPQNILFESLDMQKIPEQMDAWMPKTPAIRIIDFGTSSRVDADDHTYDIGTLPYRSPEALLNCEPWGKATDIWSVGCVALELYTGHPLFCTGNEDALLAMMERVCGRFPLWMINSAQNMKSNFMRGETLKNFLPEKDFEVFLKAKPLRQFVECKELQELLKWCLEIDPNHRPTCEEALSHQFFTKDYPSWS